MNETLIQQLNQMSSEEIRAYNKKATKALIIRVTAGVVATVVINVAADYFVKKLINSRENKIEN